MDRREWWRRRFLLAPKWSSLAKMGSSRVLKSSYIWLVAVPIAAKAIPVLQPGVAAHLGEWTPELPMNWKLFYFSSVAVAAASLLYAVRCPEVVRVYPDFVEFKKSGRTGRQLVLGYLDLLIPHSMTLLSESKYQEAHRFATDFGDTGEGSFPPLGEMDTERFRRIMRSVQVPDGQLSDAFWFVRDRSDAAHPFSRSACALAYTIGLSLLAAVFVQNVLFVLRY